jgi:hypothetical protein
MMVWYEKNNMTEKKGARPLLLLSLSLGFPDLAAAAAVVVAFPSTCRH